MCRSTQVDGWQLSPGGWSLPLVGNESAARLLLLLPSSLLNGVLQRPLKLDLLRSLVVLQLLSLAVDHSKEGVVLWVGDAVTFCYDLTLEGSILGKVTTSSLGFETFLCSKSSLHMSAAAMVGKIGR